MILNNLTKRNIIYTMVISIALPIVLGYFLNSYLALKYISIPLHSGLEVAGGVIAIIISMIFYIKYSKSHLLTHFNYTTIALLSMGIIDIFHGTVMPGKLFVWLHSTAVFFGGILFMSIWLEDKQVSKKTYRLVPIIAIVFSILFSILSIVFPEMVPQMLNEDKSFTNTANWLNIVGGIGFFAASSKFIYEYIKTQNIEELLFAGLTMLFGIAGLLFVSSVVWDMQWWLWHFLRLLAYMIALYFLYIEFDKEITFIAQTNENLEKTNIKINNYLNIIDKNVITSSTDIAGNITEVSEAFCKISGYTQEELIGQNHKIVKHADMSENLYLEMWERLKNNDSWRGEIKNQKKDGTSYWVLATISPIFNESSIKIGYTAVRQDITNRKKIELLAITDALTDIFNRRHFNELFPKIINRARRENELVSFLIMDIDHFKQYNDTYGHQKGDDVLKEVAKSMKDSMQRADDYCFRLGGEEFGVIFKPKNTQDAIVYSQKIRKNIEDLQIEHKNNSASSYITVSAGLITLNSHDAKNEDEIYKLADDLLYEAKENGRNNVSVYGNKVTNHDQ